MKCCYAAPDNDHHAGHTSEQHHRITADADIVNDGSLQQLVESTLECIAALERTL